MFDSSLGPSTNLYREKDDDFGEISVSHIVLKQVTLRQHHQKQVLKYYATWVPKKTASDACSSRR